jgi:hypothetical protein
MSIAMLSNRTSGPLKQEIERIFREHYPLVFRTVFNERR